MIEAFIFDLDGVITDTAKYHYIAWKETASKLGIEINLEFNENLKGVDRLESLERILKLKNMEKSFTREEKMKLANEKNSHYKKLIEKVAEKDILPGIKELLEELREKNIKIGLASASRNASQILNNLKINEYFDFVADAGKCKEGKPSPEIFLMACKGLYVEAKNCVGIEDARDGVEAINRAGIFSVGVGSATTLKKARYIVKDTKELKYKVIKEKLEDISITRKN